MPFTPSLDRKLQTFFAKRVPEDWGGRYPFDSLVFSKNGIFINSNDYLRISNDPTVIHAKCKALMAEGTGQMMSSVFLGSDSPQRDFEQRIADFLGFEDSILSQSGWCANTGLLADICRDTPVYIDMAAHMSLWEGARMAQTEIHRFKHNSIIHLENKIKKYGAGIVLVDSIYSTYGTVAPLKAFADICEKYGCFLLVDESHSLGVCGPEGRGLVYDLGLTEKVDVITASLSKAFSGRAGVIACSKKLRRYISLNSYTTIFSSAVTSVDVAGFEAGLDLIKDADDKRESLFENSEKIRDVLEFLDFQVPDSSSQIIPLTTGSEQNVMVLQDYLNSKNIYGSYFAPPATTKAQSMYRLSIHSDLTATEMSGIVYALKAVRKRFIDTMPAMFKKSKSVVSLGARPWIEGQPSR